MIVVLGRQFALTVERHKGWNADAFRERYSEVLDRYDYIVGDWGYSQLRLKGFYASGHRYASGMNQFETIEDYIHEYCAVRCPYFVVHRLDAQQDVVDDGVLEQEWVAEPPYRWREQTEVRKPIVRDGSRTKKEGNGPLRPGTAVEGDGEKDANREAPVLEVDRSTLDEHAKERARVPKRPVQRAVFDEDEFADVESFERIGKRNLRVGGKPSKSFPQKGNRKS
jgi:uncharacterized protein YutD